MLFLVRKIISTAKAPAAIGPYRYRRAVGAEKDSRRLGWRPRGGHSGRVGWGFGAWAAAGTAKLLKSCLTLCDPLDCSPPDSSIFGILKAKILEWVSMPSYRGSS